MLPPSMNAPGEEVGFVVASRGLEDALRAELSPLVTTHRREEGGFRYTAKAGTYRLLNLSLRTASRVYLVAGKVSVSDENALERDLSKLPLKSRLGDLSADVHVEIQEGGHLHKGKLAQSVLRSLR